MQKKPWLHNNNDLYLNEAAKQNLIKVWKSANILEIRNIAELYLTTINKKIGLCWW